MKRVSAALLALLLGACASNNSLYDWNGYSSSLLQYYKNPSETAKFASALKESLDKSEASGRVPPGLYAEYGYALLELGHPTDAVVYFKKEHDKWPESRVIMAKLISKLSADGSQSTARATDMVPTGGNPKTGQSREQ